MTVATVITEGFGSFGTVNLTITEGYGAGSAPPSPPPPPPAEIRQVSGGRRRVEAPVQIPQRVIDDVEALYTLIYENQKALDADTLRQVGDLVGFFAESYDGRLPPPAAVHWRDLVQYPSIDLGILSAAAERIMAYAAVAETRVETGPAPVPQWARVAIQQGSAVDRAMARLKKDAEAAAARAADEEEEDAIMALLTIL